MLSTLYLAVFYVLALIGLVSVVVALMLIVLSYVGGFYIELGTRKPEVKAVKNGTPQTASKK